MTAFSLRPYQADAIAAIDAAFAKGHRKPLLVMATGGGKTVVFAELARRARGRVLVIAHRDELITQAASKIEAATGIAPGIEKAEMRANACDRIVVASVQTIANARRVVAGEPFELVIIDEAHRAAADSYTQLIKRLNPPKVLGVTATPWRTDNGLIHAFDTVAYQIGMLDLIRQGHLCDVRIHTIPVSIALDAVNVRHGDFAEDDIGRALAPHIEAVADVIAQGYLDRRLLAFCPLVANSEALANALQDRGLKAAHVDGKTSDRKRVLDDFAAGRITHLSNAMLLTEGYDNPAIDAVLILRPTTSPTLMTQMIGRGTRLSDGKTHCTVIDPMFQNERHDLTSLPNLVFGDGLQGERVKRLMREREISLADAAVADAEELRLVQEREAALATRIGQGSHREGYVRSILEMTPYEQSIEEIERLLGKTGFAAYAKSVAHASPTDPQIELLEKKGVKAAASFPKAVASELIKLLIRRDGRGLATLKQLRFASGLGVDTHPEMHANEVGLAIDRAKSAQQSRQAQVRRQSHEAKGDWA